MRPLLKYGVPVAAGLATAGYAASQGEDPGSAVLAGLGGAAGGAAGLLAGRYSPQLVRMAQEKAIVPVGNYVEGIEAKIPAKSKIRAGIVANVADRLSYAQKPMGPGAERIAQKVGAGIALPTAAGLAGLGGIALGAVPGSLGMPGFQQQIDPESYGSSNSPGSRQQLTTRSAGIYR